MVKIEIEIEMLLLSDVDKISLRCKDVGNDVFVDTHRIPYPVPHAPKTRDVNSKLLTQRR